ncbi:MAG TPA: N-methyl-L-tryptophan oxidase [Gemmataceae bacterium]|nr:N-methyl-L-tryptophan oxidase [Gemmataceae bacterium]
MSQTFDVIVLGVGGMGSAACFELVRRGRRVLGLEQFPLVHSRGSSHGHTRIIRTAYYEHPNYVPLLRRAWSRWYELEQLTGRHLLTECSCLNAGPADGELVNGVRASAREHGLAVEELTAGEIARRYPFRFPDEFAGVLEQDAGFLYVEDCVRAHVDSAMSLGATIHAEEPVREWKAVGDAVEVTTDRGTYHAAKLVVTAGAWATKLLADLGVPLTVMRQVLLWFDVRGTEWMFRRDTFPIFIADVPGGPFYGLPAIDRFGLKLARHYGAPQLPNPDGVNWDATPADEPPVQAFLDTYLTDRTGARTKAQVCMYTLTPDKHFVIDRHPHFPQVTVACGFSGHGFKFASVVGEILADLAEHGRTEHPIGMFGATRFGRPITPRTS